MLSMATLRRETKDLIDSVPDDKITIVFEYINSIATKKPIKTTVNPLKKAAYEALLNDSERMPKKNISLNGTKEICDMILRKYESLN